MIFMVNEISLGRAHNLLVHSNCRLSAVFEAITFGIKSVALRDGIPVMFIKLFKIFDIYDCILATRQTNPPKRIAVTQSPVKNRNGNEPIGQWRMDYKVKFNGNYNFDGTPL